MLSESSKVLLPIAALSLLGAVIYGQLSAGDGGVTLVLGLSIAAAFGALVLIPTRRGETAPIVAPDAGPPTRRPVAVERVSLPAPGSGASPFIVGVAVVLLATSCVGGSTWAVAGIILGLLGGMTWLAQAVGDFRSRPVNVTPIAIPLAALFAIGSLLFFMSRVLLAVNNHASTAIAIVVASCILFGSAAVAARSSSIRPGMATTLLLVAGLALAGAGVVGLAHGARHEELAPTAASGGANIVASNTRFDRAEFDFVAGQPIVITFRNRQHPTYHNVAIYTDDTFTHALFNGTPINGGVITYRLNGLPAATYAFKCDFHPTMTGTVKVISP